MGFRGVGATTRLVLVAVLAVAACASGDDADDADDTLFSDGTAADPSRFLTEGAVKIEMQSSSGRFNDSLLLDVGAERDAVNDSGVHATCTPLGDAPEADLQVGVTDVRRVENDAPVVAVELVADVAVRRRGEFPAEMYVVDSEQRQSQLTGTVSFRGSKGTFAMTSDDNVQVRGTFACGRTADELTRATTPRRQAVLAGLDVRVTVDDGKEASMSARARTLRDIDAADARAPAHCSAVADPDAEPYVVRLDSERARRVTGGMRRFELVVADAADPEANAATLEVDGRRTVRATGSVRFGEQRTSGTFAGRTQDGEEVTAPFTCRSG